MYYNQSKKCCSQYNTELYSPILLIKMTSEWIEKNTRPNIPTPRNYHNKKLLQFGPAMMFYKCLVKPFACVLLNQQDQCVIAHVLECGDAKNCQYYDGSYYEYQFSQKLKNTFCIVYSRGPQRKKLHISPQYRPLWVGTKKEASCWPIHLNECQHAMAHIPGKNCGFQVMIQRISQETFLTEK